ncbi:MAG TPA: hypothetical protein VFN43_08185 [Humibacillus sp.]|nr:hypothetical protein [Humibacillus sp.]
MSRSSRSEGLSLAYRLGYRLRLAALSLLGPAELDELTDPKARLRRERERKIEAARAARDSRAARDART